MCLIAFAWQVQPRWRLLLAGNRDEFHARSSAALARWAGAPLIGGRDLEAGGAWLGVTDTGRCAVVTNVRDPHDPQVGASRGRLVADYLAGSEDAATHARVLLDQAVHYRPFNLLLFDARAACYLSNRPASRTQELHPGVYGLSNAAALDPPWPKARRLTQRMRTWLEADDDDFAPLFEALADERHPPDAELPDTGVGLERERWLSAAFIRGERYGTRASTVLAIDHAGRGVIVERRFGPGGRFEGQTMLHFGPG